MTEQTYEIRAELESKTSDALIRILTDRRDGICSPSQASYAIRTLFDATSGLVSKELFDMITEASREVESDLVDRSVRVLVKRDTSELVVLSYAYGEAHLNMTKGVFPGPFVCKAVSFSEENPFEAAHQRLDAYAELLKSRGFEEVALC